MVRGVGYRLVVGYVEFETAYRLLVLHAAYLEYVQGQLLRRT